MLNAHRRFPIVTRLVLAVTIVTAWCLVDGLPRVAAEATLDIGSKAPAIDVEHWIQDGNGRFKPFEEFEDGNVYVIEFWATWCGPCIMSMPHLAELQTEYRDKDVRIVSISDETVDEVKDLLGQENPELEMTFADITAPYSLTTDPDRSVHTDYMEASGADGIPTAYLVGKDGRIEWIGHPMALDEPLAKVVEGTWDREKFKADRDAQVRQQQIMQTMAKLARQGRIDEAMELVQTQIDRDPASERRPFWESVLNSLKLSAGQIDDDVIEYYRSNIEKMKANPQDMLRFAYSIYGIHMDGGDVGPLAAEARGVLESLVEDAPDDARPVFLNSIALMHRVDGENEQAIDVQQRAVEAAEGSQKERLQQALEAFKEELKAGTEAQEDVGEATGGEGDDAE